MAEMRIDLFHDTACPWCRIGKAHLKAALEQWDGGSVQVYYHTFFLNPSIPPEGYPFREYMHTKGGGQMPLEGWFAAPREAGQRAGLDFHFERIEHAPNTLLSHQLIALTPDDQREAVIDAVYAAYFEHGQDIGSLDVLVAIAAAQGLDRDTVAEQLRQGTAQQHVLADAAQAAQLGITGVPFFIFNQRLAFSGAQPPAVILDVMQQAQQEVQS